MYVQDFGWEDYGLWRDFIFLYTNNVFAWYKSRRIADNVQLAQELVKNYHSEGGAETRLGLMKAYDLVDWDLALVFQQQSGSQESS